MIAQTFWECAYAKTESAFDKIPAEIQELNDEAVEYISRLPRERWILYSVMSAKFGHITSNIQESQNAE